MTRLWRNGFVAALALCSAAACKSDGEDNPLVTSTASNDPGFAGASAGGSVSSSGGSEPEPGSLPVSETGVCNNLLAAPDIPFATAVFASTDACPFQRRGATPEPSTTVADVRREATGKYCVRGDLSSGFAILIVSFDHINDRPTPAFHGPLDVAALGVASLRFSLESAPSTGLHVTASNVTRDACPEASDNCQTVFDVLDEAGAPTTLTEPGTYTERIVDARAAAGSSTMLDPSRFSGIGFEIPPGTFDFCVGEVGLLDAAGQPIAPPR